MFIAGTTYVRLFCLTITSTSDVRINFLGGQKLSAIGEDLIHWAY
jgi:hypothetical protein